MSAPAATENRVVAGRYRLRRVVGRGGMGVLWQARDEMLGRDVAVKEFHKPADADGDCDGSARERALREARAAARVRHPSAVTVFDVVEEDGRPWIVMELLPSRTLADVVAVDGPLEPDAVARVGLDLLDALSAAHDVGVVHRDVKPGNILFADGRAVLVDFGIATVDGDSTITLSGQLLGSPAFMAPERARGEEPTAASDLWSLGATLFTAVEGDAPFRRNGHLPTLAAVVTQEAPPALHAGTLRPLIEGLLARDPEERPTAARARAMLLEALAPAAEVPLPATAGDIDPDDEGEPTVESPVFLDVPTEQHPAPAGSPEGGRSGKRSHVRAPRIPRIRGSFIPRPRRIGALAAALLAPATLFALALAWPGRASVLLDAPRAVVTAPSAGSSGHTSTSTSTRTTRTTTGTTTTRTTSSNPQPEAGTAQVKVVVLAAQVSRPSAALGTPQARAPTDDQGEDGDQGDEAHGSGHGQGSDDQASDQANDHGKDLGNDHGDDEG